LVGQPLLLRLVQRRRDGDVRDPPVPLLGGELDEAGQ
jgi:hypothetical protein